jgi:hypothetical protein
VWKLVNYPGGINRILMKYGTRMPVIRRMFDPGYQKFIAVEGIWCRKRCEKYLHRILETACAMHGLYAAAIWLDERSPVVETVRSAGRLGIIHYLMKPAVGEIRVKFNHVSEGEKMEYSEKPAYISCFDMT